MRAGACGWEWPDAFRYIRRNKRQQQGQRRVALQSTSGTSQSRGRRWAALGREFWRSGTWWGRVLLRLVPLLVMLPHALGIVQYGLVTRLEQQLGDAMLLHGRTPATLDERIVIVDIDEASLQQHGRWPWSRSVLAAMCDELLHRQQVAVMGYDVLFAEPEHDDTLSRVSEWLRSQRLAKPAAEGQLKQLEQRLDRDALLVQALREQPVALGYYYSDRPPVLETGNLTPPLRVAQLPGDPLEFPRVPLMQGYAGNLPELVAAVGHGGFINADIDSDGVLRSIPLVARRSENGASVYYPALSLEMLMMALQVDSARLLPLQQEGAAPSPRLVGIQLQQGDRSLVLPTATGGRFIVPFRRGSGVPDARYRYVSARDVLAGRLAEGELRNKLVLVGTTAPGLRDMRATPVSTAYPGVEVHASVLSAMLDGDFLQVPDYSRGYAAMAMLLAVVLLLIVMTRTGMVGALLWSLGLAAAFVIFHLELFRKDGLILPLASILLTILLTYVLHTSAGFFVERRTKRQLVELFGHYVPSELVARMAHQPEQYIMQASSRELTVMFCDLQQFTSLSEAMDPAELQAFLNDIFNRMAGVIGPNQGTIDKYMGDCVMVFWGAPVPDTAHAWKAVKTAIELCVMLEDFNTQREAAGMPPILVSIGINTGLMSVGDMGSEMRRSYTVIGDAVNLAARLEPLARTYGVPVVVGERTAQQVEQCHWQWLDRIRVSGKAQAVHIYAPFTNDAQLDAAQQHELGLWHQFREAYGVQDWQRCDTLLAKLQALAPGRVLYALYRKRIDDFLVRPPAAGWDGVTQQHPEKPVGVTYLTDDGA